MEAISGLSLTSSPSTGPVAVRRRSDDSVKFSRVRPVDLRGLKGSSGSNRSRRVELNISCRHNRNYGGWLRGGGGIGGNDNHKNSEFSEGCHDSIDSRGGEINNTISGSIVTASLERIKGRMIVPKIPMQLRALGHHNSHTSKDEALLLQSKANDVAPYLNDRCIYLVGMMGSGKTTVGTILAGVLGYSFFDSDKLVEQSVGVSSVAQIFKEHSEAFFRDNESKVLENLSSMHRLVVATGGGAVIRPINWRYMKEGLTIWLDVPLEALARRIAAVGTASRPLLHGESGDPYKKAFMRLSALAEQRGTAYSNADARVSLEHIAAKQGHTDVSALTPTAIAIESLEQVKNFSIKDPSVRQNSYLKG